MCSPTVIWIQNKGFPNGSTYHGTDAAIENVFQSFSDTWEKFGFEIDTYMVAERSVIVTSRYVARSRASNKELPADACHVYWLEKGKVTTFQQYSDTRASLRPRQRNPSRAPAELRDV